jgi:hypothetical protein
VSFISCRVGEETVLFFNLLVPAFNEKLVGGSSFSQGICQPVAYYIYYIFYFSKLLQSKIFFSTTSYHVLFFYVTLDSNFLPVLSPSTYILSLVCFQTPPSKSPKANATQLILTSASHLCQMCTNHHKI